MRLFNFYRPDCIGCQVVKNSLSNTSFTVIDIDITKVPVTAAKYSVMSVPMLVLVDEMGNEITRSRNVNDIIKVLK